MYLYRMKRNPTPLKFVPLFFSYIGIQNPLSLGTYLYILAVTLIVLKAIFQK